MMTGRELHEIACRRRDREAIIFIKAVMKARRMTRRDIRRAESRQGQFLMMRATVIAAETMSVLLVSLMGILAYFQIRRDIEATFYAVQLTIELFLLFSAYAVIVSGGPCLHVYLTFSLLVGLSLNIIQIVYFILYDRHTIGCNTLELPSGDSLCINSQPVFKHHTSFTSVALAIAHFILVIVSIAMAAKYEGSLSKIIDDTDSKLLISQCRKHRKSKTPSSKRAHSKRITSSKSLYMQYPGTSTSSCPGLEIMRLPDGTKLKTSNTKTFNMEYYVEDGVFYGTGKETLDKAINISAPVRPMRQEKSTVMVNNARPSNTFNSLTNDQNEVGKKEDVRSL